MKPNCDIDEHANVRFMFTENTASGAVSSKRLEIKNLIKDLKDLPDERCQHIVYVFLLGVGIYHKEEKLKEKTFDTNIKRILIC